MRAFLKFPRLWLYASVILVLAAATPAMAAGVSVNPIFDSATGDPLLWPSYTTEYDGALYFRTKTIPSSSDTGLWRFDGSEAVYVQGTLGTEPSYLAVSNSKLYYCAGTSGSPSTLWQYTVADGPSQCPGSSSAAQLPQDLIGYNGQLYFRAARFGAPSNIGIELWKFDGTNQTPIDMFPGSGSSYPQHFIQYNGLLYFNACGTPGQGGELWATNGTGAPFEAARIYPGNGSSPENFAVYNNQLYFSAYDGTHGRELWKFNGDVATIAYDIVTGGQYASSNPHDLITYNGKLYFGANDGTHGDELWSFDGTTAQMVAEINPTADPGNGDTFMMDSFPHNMVVFNGILYFAANDGQHGVELWSFDGAEAKMVMDINPGQYGSGVEELTVYNGALYFSADDSYAPSLQELRPQVFMLTPEPATLALMAFGALALLWRRKR
ncbi:MAG: PEP-CTERM sorting domain-containing protein [Planctomycetota bacterium]|nr:PEP-CTERM sorting domain-containing protein [Planctomycetota bacterium]